MIGMIKIYLLVALHVSVHTSLVDNTFPKINIEIWERARTQYP